MNSKEIIQKYLKENGYDGLMHAETECGCDINDICLNDCDFSECVPAWRCKYDKEIGFCSDMINCPFKSDKECESYLADFAK